MAPIERKKDRYVISQNVRRLMGEGKSRSVAVAIAFKEAAAFREAAKVDRINRQKRK